MTIIEAQQSIDQWIRQYGGGYYSELTNLGILAEETGELARWIVRKYGDQSLKESEKEMDIEKAIEDEITDILWVLICLANQMNIDLDKGLEKNMIKKTIRDKERHNYNKEK